MKIMHKIKTDSEIDKEDMWPSIETSLKLFLEENFEGKLSNHGEVLFLTFGDTGIILYHIVINEML